MSKNIIIFSDGTGQEGGRGNNTNIYKLFNMVEDRTSNQIAFYGRGVGTGVRLFTGMVGGRGFGRNVKECYEFIFRNYEAGDRLFLIGFSRGAATVRSLSYFIHLFGILPHSRPELISQAWKIYRNKNREQREEEARAFIRKHHTMWAKVHFLGCYDTVAALGMPFPLGSVLLDMIPWFRHRFHSYDLSPGVVHARHALAIDDERHTFHPVLWAPVELSRQKGKMACESMKQVWFSGMHTDVGGGYPESTLSDIPLIWLTQEAVAAGLKIYPDHHVAIEEDADGFMHDSRGKGWTRLYRRRVRRWDGSRSDRPVVHASVLQRRRNRLNTDTSPYESWILALEPLVEPWIRYEDQPWHPSRRKSGLRIEVSDAAGAHGASASKAE